MPPEHKLAWEVRETELAEEQDGQVRILSRIGREIPRLDLMPAHLYPVQVLHARNLRRGLGHRARMAEFFDLRFLAHVHGRRGRIEGDRDLVLIIEVHRSIPIRRARARLVQRVVVWVCLALRADARGRVGELQRGRYRGFLEQGHVAPHGALRHWSLWQPLQCGRQAKSPRFARPRLRGRCSTRGNTRRSSSCCCCCGSGGGSGSGVDFRPRPLHVLGEDKPRGDDPFVEALVEEVPVDEILGAIWVGVNIGTGRAGRGRRARNRFVADGKDLSEAFFSASGTMGSYCIQLTPYSHVLLVGVREKKIGVAEFRRTGDKARWMSQIPAGVLRKGSP